jgi:hypothetical protein
MDGLAKASIHRHRTNSTPTSSGDHVEACSIHHGMAPAVMVNLLQAAPQVDLACPQPYPWSWSGVLKFELLQPEQLLLDIEYGYKTRRGGSAWRADPLRGPWSWDSTQKTIIAMKLGRASCSGGGGA